MGNTFQQELVVPSSGPLLWRTSSTAVSRLTFNYRATSPDGVLTAPAGSLVAGGAGLWVNSSGTTAWAQVMTSLAFSLAPNEYYVDQTASPLAAPFRIYTSIAAAVTAAEANADLTGLPYIVRLREGQAHAWTGQGLPASSSRQVLISCEAVEGAELILSGVMPAAAAGGSLRLQNLTVSLGGDLTVGYLRALSFDNCWVDGGQNTLRFDSSSVQADNTGFFDVMFDSTGSLGSFGMVCQSCGFWWGTIPASTVLVSGFLLYYLVNCDIQVEGEDFVVFESKNSNVYPIPPFSAVVADISNTSIKLFQTGAGTAQLFSRATTSTLNLVGVSLSCRAPLGEIDYGCLSSNLELMRSLTLDPKNLPSGSWHNLGAAGTIRRVQRITFGSVTLGSYVLGASSPATLVFTNQTDLPADGVIEVNFPPGFDLSAVGFSSYAVNPVVAVGGFVLTVSGQTVRLERDGLGAVFPAATQSTLVLSGVHNPDTAGTTAHFFVTTYQNTATNGQLDIGDESGVVITT